MTDEKGQPQSDYKKCLRKFALRFVFPIFFLAMAWIIGGTVVAANGQSEWVEEYVLITTLILLSFLLFEAYRRGWSDRDGGRQSLFP